MKKIINPILLLNVFIFLMAVILIAMVVKAIILSSQVAVI